MLIPILNESKILPIYGAFRLKKKADHEDPPEEI